MRPPHRFPFELVDREVDGAGSVSVSAGSWWLRGDRELTLPWLVEAVAQAAARTLTPSPGSDGRLALAGIDDARLERAIGAGERCELRTRIAGHWGRVAKVEGEVWVGGRQVGSLALLLAAAPSAVASG